MQPGQPDPMGAVNHPMQCCNIFTSDLRFLQEVLFGSLHRAIC